MRWCGHAAVYIGDAAYTAVPDCPRRAIPCFDLTITDRFWRRKIDTNAGVSIPLEVRKLTETPRGLIDNVLEAAILSLRTHPNRQLQAIVDEPIGELRRERRSGNSAFEVAAASYMTTGRRLGGPPLRQVRDGRPAVFRRRTGRDQTRCRTFPPARRRAPS